jgi:3-phytase
VPTGDRVDAREVRDFRVPTEPVDESKDQLTEACVADDEGGALYVAEEDVGIWRYGAEPDAGEGRTQVDSTGEGGHLTADVESLYHAADGGGYLLASSQGDDSFSVYERGTGNPFAMRFGIGASEVDQVGATDGIEVANVALGDAFPRGIFVAHDGYNPIAPSGDRQNFKLVPWERVARSMSRWLTVDTDWDAFD